jgi:hypothetical protein
MVSNRIKFIYSNMTTRDKTAAINVRFCRLENQFSQNYAKQGIFNYFIFTRPKTTRRDQGKAKDRGESCAHFVLEVVFTHFCDTQRRSSLIGKQQNAAANCQYLDSRYDKSPLGN